MVVALPVVVPATKMPFPLVELESFALEYVAIKIFLLEFYKNNCNAITVLRSSPEDPTPHSRPVAVEELAFRTYPLVPTANVFAVLSETPTNKSPLASNLLSSSLNGAAPISTHEPEFRIKVPPLAELNHN
jgi:hypothetical protein